MPVLVFVASGQEKIKKKTVRQVLDKGVVQTSWHTERPETPPCSEVGTWPTGMFNRHTTSQPSRLERQEINMGILWKHKTTSEGWKGYSNGRIRFRPNF